VFKNCNSNNNNYYYYYYYLRQYMNKITKSKDRKSYLEETKNIIIVIITSF